MERGKPASAVMSPFGKFLRSYGHLLFWPVVGIIIFLPAIGFYTVFPSPDSPPPLHANDGLIAFLESISRLDSIALYDLLRLILPQLVWTDLYYYFAVIATSFAGYWFMRERDAPPVPSLLSGGALAFAGYSFTLLSAGHRAYFAMMPYVACTFAFLTCAIRRRDLFAYALAGASAAWTFHFGPDIAASILFVAALYALRAAVTEARRATSPDCRVNEADDSVAAKTAEDTKALRTMRPLRQNTCCSCGCFWPRFLAGCAVAALAFAIVAGPSIYHVTTSTLSWRRAQIEGSRGSALTASADGAAKAAKPDDSSAKADTSAEDDSAAEAAKKEEQWIFATNWSLPPEETIELVAPSIFGTWSGDRKAPYWGRLGRSASWDPRRPGETGFFNFRQHDVYLGSIVVALALFAIVCALVRWCDGLVVRWSGGRVVGSSGGRVVGTRNPETSKLRNFETPKLRNSETPFYLSDVLFWSIVGIVALLLAYGRYAPFYRLFYSIPFMSYMRAPVKLMRVVELAAAVLAGSGLALLCSRDCPARAKKWFAGVAACAAVACAVYAYSISTSRTFASILSSLGAGGLAGPMARHAVSALCHPIVGFALVSVAAYALAKDSSRARPVAWVLLVAFAIDVCIAVRPFTFTEDYSHVCKPNLLTETVMSDTDQSEVPGVTILGNPPLEMELVNRQFGVGRIRRHPQDNIDHNAFLAASRGDIAAMCRLTGSRFVVIPATMSRGIDRKKLKHVMFFHNFGTAGYGIVKTPNQGSMELLRVPEILPYCSLHAKWEKAGEGDWMARAAVLRATDTLVCDLEEAPPAGNGEASAGTARLIVRRGRDGTLDSKIETDSAVETILLLLERPDDNCVAKVDGVETKTCKAGYAPYVGVHLHPGHHTVTYGPRHSYRPAFYSIPVLLLFIASAILFAFRRYHQGLGD